MFQSNFVQIATEICRRTAKLLMSRDHHDYPGRRLRQSTRGIENYQKKKDTPDIVEEYAKGATMAQQTETEVLKMKSGLTLSTTPSVRKWEEETIDV